MIENELFPAEEGSNLIEVLDRAMVGQPGYWQSYYHGNDNEKANARKYSFSDRSRYYWPIKEVQNAVQRLFDNLGKDPIPLTMLSQYLPEQYASIRAGLTPNDSLAMIQDKLYTLLDVYRVATDL